MQAAAISTGNILAIRAKSLLIIIFPLRTASSDHIRLSPEANRDLGGALTGASRGAARAVANIAAELLRPWQKLAVARRMAIGDPRMADAPDPEELRL